jgi:hypothetical protein
MPSLCLLGYLQSAMALLRGYRPWISCFPPLRFQQLTKSAKSQLITCPAQTPSEFTSEGDNEKAANGEDMAEIRQGLPQEIRRVMTPVKNKAPTIKTAQTVNS